MKKLGGEMREKVEGDGNKGEREKRSENLEQKRGLSKGEVTCGRPGRESLPLPLLRLKLS